MSMAVNELVPISGDQGSRVITREQLVLTGWVDIALFEIALEDYMVKNPGVVVASERDVASGGIAIRWWRG